VWAVDVGPVAPASTLLASGWFLGDEKLVDEAAGVADSLLGHSHCPAGILHRRRSKRPDHEGVGPAVDKYCCYD
jgi:hypothetical protein